MNWETAIASLATLFALIGGVVGAVEYFAKDCDLTLVELRLDQKIRNDEMYSIQEQLWRFEDRYEGSPLSDWPFEDRERYRKLRYRWKVLEQQAVRGG